MEYKSSVRALFRFIAPNWATYLFGILLYSLQGYVFSYCMGLLTSWVSAAMLSGIPGALACAIVRFLLLFLLVIASTAAGIYALFMTRHKAEGRMKRQVLSNFLYSGIENNHRYEAGISALNTEVSRAAELYDNATADVLGCVFSVGLSLATLMVISWKIGLLSVFIGVLAFIQHAGFAHPRNQIEEKRFSANRRFVNLITNMTQKMPSIRAYHGEKKVESEFEGYNQSLLNTYVKESLIDLKQSLIGGVQNLLVILCVWGIGSYMVATGELSFSHLVMAPFMANTLANGISGISSAFSYIQGPLVSCRNLEPLLCAKTDKQEYTKYVDWSQWDEDATIRLKELSFRYEGNESLALHEISLLISSGKTVAIVGKSGSGKSTLLRAIIGLFKQDKLPIYLGNMSYGDMNTSVWREKFAFVDQSVNLFNMTVAENICLGNLEHGTQEQIEAAAKAVGADQFIRNLPEGYNTVCGENGVALSGGQKKLITLARAMIRHAPVLILDEPTSALDEKAIAMVQEALTGLRGQKTILFSTHDPNLAKQADLIVMMSEGRIIQTGSHDDLIYTGGEYRNLCQHGEKT